LFAPRHSLSCASFVSPFSWNYSYKFAGGTCLLLTQLSYLDKELVILCIGIVVIVRRFHARVSRHWRVDYLPPDRRRLQRQTLRRFDPCFAFHDIFSISLFNEFPMPCRHFLSGRIRNNSYPSGATGCSNWDAPVASSALLQFDKEYVVLCVSVVVVIRRFNASTEGNR
jgi:hypothetical protein